MDSGFIEVSMRGFSKPSIFYFFVNVMVPTDGQSSIVRVFPLSENVYFIQVLSPYPVPPEIQSLSPSIFQFPVELKYCPLDPTATVPSLLNLRSIV